MILMVLRGSGGRRGAARPPPPPICKHNACITGSESVHRGSVIAGRMLVEASLHGLEKRRGWRDRQPPVCSLYKQIAWLMDSEEFCGRYVFEKSKLAQLKKESRGVEGVQPLPTCKRNACITGSERVQICSSWLHDVLLIIKASLHG